MTPAAATVETMGPSQRLPLPPEEGRQVFKESGRPSRRARPEHWLLKVDRGEPDLPIRRTIAFYYPRPRQLVRKVHARHAYGRRPGIAWNLELLRRADHWHNRPKALVVHNLDTLADGTLPKPYVLDWLVVRAFAWAALTGDERWLIQEDVDDQLLLPWPAWRGTWTTPPPEDALVPETEDAPTALQGVLLDLPPDPKPVQPRFPV